jgi:hypothetical protein
MATFVPRPQPQFGGISSRSDVAATTPDLTASPQAAAMSSVLAALAGIAGSKLGPTGQNALMALAGIPTQLDAIKVQNAAATQANQDRERALTEVGNILQETYLPESKYFKGVDTGLDMIGQATNYKLAQSAKLKQGQMEQRDAMASSREGGMLGPLQENQAAWDLERGMSEETRGGLSDILYKGTQLRNDALLSLGGADEARMGQIANNRQAAMALRASILASPVNATDASAMYQTMISALQFGQQVRLQQQQLSTQSKIAGMQATSGIAGASIGAIGNIGAAGLYGSTSAQKA